MIKSFINMHEFFADPWNIIDAASNRRAAREWR
jgi:hypothetical protein